LLELAHRYLMERGELPRESESFPVWVHVADLGWPDLQLPLHPPGGATLSTVSRHRHDWTLLPDYTLGSEWPAIGLDGNGSFMGSLEAFTKTLMAAGQKPPVAPQAFFAGDLSFHPTRSMLHELARANPDALEIRDVPAAVTAAMPTAAYDRQDAQDRTAEQMGPSSRVPFAQFAHWAILLDLPGGGWSGRLKFLPFLQRPLIVVERPAWGWADGAVLQPYEHYRPVRVQVEGKLSERFRVTFDPDDVLREVQWIRRHPRRAAKMVQRALERATEAFSTEAVTEQAAKVIREQVLDVVRSRSIERPHAKYVLGKDET